MGPKPGNLKDARKNVKGPKVDKNEIVTELMKQFFEFQLKDIDKKIIRLTERQEELKGHIAETEGKIDDFGKEKSSNISDQETLLGSVVEEKHKKREEMVWLIKEIKIRLENHKKHVDELREKHNNSVNELTKELEKVKEELCILEDFKQNKDVYGNQLVELETQMEETEMQHERNLFEINRNWEMAKVKVKKELESKLLNLSIEFQQISQKKLGSSCHRVTQENKAIQNELEILRDELKEYHENLEKSRANLSSFRKQIRMKTVEKEKSIAKTMTQGALISTLLKDSRKLVESLKEYSMDELENRALLRKLKSLEYEIEKKMNSEEEVKSRIEGVMEEIKSMNENSVQLKRTYRKLHVLSRNALKIAEEAKAVYLIPLGGTDEEKYMSSGAKIHFFKKRKEAVFQKKGRILQYLFDFISRVQMSEEEKHLLRYSKVIDFESEFKPTFGKGLYERDLEKKESTVASIEEPRATASASDNSLPRSISESMVSVKQSETEYFDGEYEEESSAKLSDKEPTTVPPSVGDEAVGEVASESEESDVTKDLSEDSSI